MSRLDYTRRDFLKTIGAGATSLTVPWLLSSCACNSVQKEGQMKMNEVKRHIVTLSFDDGFRKSSVKTAEIYEKYSLSACINVIATGHHANFAAPDKGQANVTKGDFVLWNELQERGHEIMPHGYRHAHLPGETFEAAKDLILRCLDCFSDNLKGFDPKKAIFNFPYNASTPELEKWLVTKVRAFRTGGAAINPLPGKSQVKLTCISHGPDNCERSVENAVEKLLSKDSGWLIYNTHGLDGEGWGPMRSSFLDKLLERLSAIGSVKIIPAGKALSQLGSYRA